MFFSTFNNLKLYYQKIKKSEKREIFLFRNPKNGDDDERNHSFKYIKNIKENEEFFYYYTQNYNKKGTYDSAKEKMKNNCHLVYKYNNKQHYIGKSYDYQIIKEDDKKQIFTVKYYFKKQLIINCGKLKKHVFQKLNLPIPESIVEGILESKLNKKGITEYIKDYLKSFMYIFDESAKTQLLYRSCQSSKTEYIINLIKNRKNKVIFFVDNSLNQKDQLFSRLNNTTDFTIKSLSGNKKMDDDNIKDYLNSDVIIACTNKIQRKNILKILNKADHKYDLYIDEVDSRLTVFKDNDFFSKILNCDKIYKIGTITATPKRFFEFFKEKEFKLSLYNQKYTYDVDKYHKLENLNFFSLENIKILKNNAKIFYPSGNQNFQHLATRDKLFDEYNCNAVIINNTHKLKIHFKETAIKNISKDNKELIKNEGTKIVIEEILKNQNVKELLIKILEEKNIININKIFNERLQDNLLISKNEIIDEIIQKYKDKLELSEKLPLIMEYYKLDNQRVGLTGKQCLGRGITIQSPYFMITDAIFDYKKIPNYCNMYQLFGRLNGNFLKWDNYTKINIFCSEKLKTTMLAMEDISCNFYYKYKDNNDMHLENYKKMLCEKLIIHKNNEFDFSIEFFRSNNGDLNQLKNDIKLFIRENIPYYNNYKFHKRDYDENNFIVEGYDTKNKSKKSCEDIINLFNNQTISSHLNNLKTRGHCHRVYFCYEDINNPKTLCAYYKYVEKKKVEEVDDDDIPIAQLYNLNN